MRKLSVDPFFLGFLVAASMVAGALIIGAIMPRPAALVSTSPRPAVEGAWRFEPKADMTNAELAMAVALMFGGPDFIPSVGTHVQALPPEFRRHWRGPVVTPVTTGQEQAK